MGIVAANMGIGVASEDSVAVNAAANEEAGKGDHRSCVCLTPTVMVRFLQKRSVVRLRF